MKYKLLVVIALTALIAAGCNKKQHNNDTNNYSTPAPTEQNSSASNNQNQGIAVGEPNPSQPGGIDQPKPKPTPTPEPHYSGETDVQPAPNMPEVVEVKITPNGFSPSTVTIKKSDYVQFTNGDSEKHWPVSDPHPSHTAYPGFDADKALKQGENYRFQFTKTGTWGYHDHLNTSLKGTVVVQ